MMFDDLSTLPVAGGALLAAAIYAGVSVFVTGPVVGERTIIKSGWTQSCPSQLSARADTREHVDLTSTLDCTAILGTIYGKEGETFCRHYGASLPFGSIMGEVMRRQREAAQARVTAAASMAPTKCQCAVNVVLEDRRTSLAIYAGSLRLIKPAPVKALPAELRLALNSPACSVKE